MCSSWYGCPLVWVASPPGLVPTLRSFLCEVCGVERWPQVEEKAGRAQKQVVLGIHPGWGGPARS